MNTRGEKERWYYSVHSIGLLEDGDEVTKGYDNNDDDDDGIGGRDGDSTRTGNRKPKERGQRNKQEAGADTGELDITWMDG